MKEEEEEEEDWLRPLHVAAVDIDTGRPNRWKIAPALFYFNVKLFPVESFFFFSFSFSINSVRYASGSQKNKNKPSETQTRTRSEMALSMTNKSAQREREKKKHRERIRSKRTMEQRRVITICVQLVAMGQKSRGRDFHAATSHRSDGCNQIWIKFLVFFFFCVSCMFCFVIFWDWMVRLDNNNAHSGPRKIKKERKKEKQVERVAHSFRLLAPALESVGNHQREFM